MGEMEKMMQMQMQVQNIRDAALLYYREAPPSEKDDVDAIFSAMRADDNGVISKEEFHSQLIEILPDEDTRNLFFPLENPLDFNEFVTLHYIRESRPACQCCRHRLLDLFYSCVICWKDHIGNMPQERGSEPFSLCVRCYSHRLYEHQHTEFLDNYMLFQSKGILVEKSGDRDSLVRKSKESPMQSVFHAGHFYYQGLGHEAKNLADKLFEDMDGNGDGMVSVNEVILFLKKNGLEQSDAVKIFEYMGMGMSIQEDLNLTVEDAVAVWYAFFMRPYCRKCNTIIMGTYYSCVTCYNMSTARAASETWDLCADCHDRRKFWHEHETFLDNFVLFHMKNQLENIQGNQSLAQGSGSNPIGQYGVQVVQGSSSNLIVHHNVQVVQGSCSNPIVQHDVQGSSSSPNVTHDVPSVRRRLCNVLIKSLEILAEATISAAMGALCAIM